MSETGTPIQYTWLLGPAFIAVLILVVWLKRKLPEKYEIKPIDAGIALIPFVLWMATTGLFKSIELPGLLKLEIANVFSKAAAAPIKYQVTKLPLKSVKAGRKRGVETIPGLISKGTEALSFQLGYPQYYGPAVWKFFNNLIQTPKFKYVVIKDKNGSLFGLYDAHRLISALNPPTNDELLNRYPLKPFYSTPDEGDVKLWSDFARAIKRSDLESLKRYPGFIGVDKAVDINEDKKKALEKMETLDVNWLPVVDKSNGKYKLAGVVDRPRLTASLIIDVTNQLEAAKKKQ